MAIQKAPKKTTKTVLLFLLDTQIWILVGRRTDLSQDALVSGYFSVKLISTCELVRPAFMS